MLVDVIDKAARDARATRADHILDVAAGLLIRFGYRKVTVDDIAAQAGIGKGTIYLHWKTREDLFVAALLREFLGSLDDLVERLSSEPTAVLLHRLTRAQFLGVVQRPLLRALYTSDPDVLGKLMTALRDTLDPRHHTAFEDYLRLLTDAGLLRDDLRPADISYVFHAIFDGFLRTDHDTASAADAEARADLLADTIRRALEPDGRTTVDTLRPIAARAATLFAESADTDRAVLRRAYESAGRGVLTGTAAEQRRTAELLVSLSD